MKSDNRSAKWDNLKTILIFFVVMGHALYPFRKESELLKGFYLFIYVFHMPLFLFVSGLFSKTIIQKKQWNRVFGYLSLYLFIRLLDTIGAYVLRGQLHLNFFETYGPDWYALSVFIFLLVTIAFQRVKPVFLLGAAMIVGLIAGFSSIPGSLFAYMRSCVFYPFFLLGYYLDPAWIEKKCRPDLSRAARIIFALIILFFIIKGADFYPFVHICKARRTFAVLGYSGMEGILLRGLQYLCALGLGAFLLMAAPDKENILSSIGRKTLPIFAWHYLFLNIFFGLSGKALVMRFFPHTYPLAILVLCILLILFTSSPLFEKTKLVMKVFDFMGKKK